MKNIFDSLISRSRAKNNGYRKGVNDERKKCKGEIANLKKELRTTKRKYLDMERRMNKNFLDAVKEVAAIKDKAVNDLNYHRSILEKEKAIIREVLARSKEIMAHGGILYDYFINLRDRKQSLEQNELESIDGKLKVFQGKRVSGDK
jgi:hypothetical protein